MLGPHPINISYVKKIFVEKVMMRQAHRYTISRLILSRSGCMWNIVIILESVPSHFLMDGFWDDVATV